MSEGTDSVEAPPTTGGDVATEAVRERIVETPYGEQLPRIC